ncbi:unnamed protein product, partial [Nesidiocoris tenuis]
MALATVRRPPPPPDYSAIMALTTVRRPPPPTDYSALAKPPTKHQTETPRKLTYAQTARVGLASAKRQPPSAPYQAEILDLGKSIAIGSLRRKFPGIREEREKLWRNTFQSVRLFRPLGELPCRRNLRRKLIFLLISTNPTWPKFRSKILQNAHLSIAVFDIFEKFEQGVVKFAQEWREGVGTVGEEKVFDDHGDRCRRRQFDDHVLFVAQEIDKSGIDEDRAPSISILEVSASLLLKGRSHNLTTYDVTR